MTKLCGIRSKFSKMNSTGHRRRLGIETLDERVMLAADFYSSYDDGHSISLVPKDEYRAPIDQNDYITPLAKAVIESATPTDGGGMNLPPQIQDAYFMVMEGMATGSFVGVVSATDFEGDPISYSITGGNEAGDFAIDADTGRVTVAGEIVYENVGYYELEISASDLYGTGTTIIPVAVIAPVADLMVDSNNDGTVDAFYDAQPEDTPPGMFLNKNGDDDDGNGVLDLHDAGPLQNSDYDLELGEFSFHIYLASLPGGPLDGDGDGFIEGYTATLDASEGVKLWDSRS
jgi:hypothetical protein